MTRKDFELIARALRDARPAVTSRNEEMTRERLSALNTAAELMASELASTNPRFNRERFLKACGLDYE